MIHLVPILSFAALAGFLIWLDRACGAHRETVSCYCGRTARSATASCCAHLCLSIAVVPISGVRLRTW